MNHISVLKNETTTEFEYLAGLENPIFVDGTLGLAGHSSEIANFLKAKGRDFKIIAIDKDEKALDISHERIKTIGLKNHFIFIQDDFKNIEQIVKHLDIQQIDGALMDLGVSSMQLDDKSRGFSFTDPNSSLDMRMDQKQDFSAIDIINDYASEKLAKIFFDYGEEQYGNSIAKAIAKARTSEKIKTVGQLLEIIKSAVPPKYVYKSGKHFATRTFQALRIEVNRELIGLDKAIQDFVKLLAPGTKLAIITFHSLEDRIVKNAFKELASECICPPKAPQCICNHKASVRMEHKKPILPSEDEIRSNPRSRSAKLRVVEKL